MVRSPIFSARSGKVDTGFPQAIQLAQIASTDQRRASIYDFADFAPVVVFL
jgi:hypothetical protein